MASNITRSLANFSPSLWTSTFSSLSFLNSEFESYCRQVEDLKEEVEAMLMASTGDPVENIEFINLLCCLGVSYHFEREIEEQLNNIFSNIEDLTENNNFDLFTTSLLFRVLRQHGFKLSCDVFKKFKDNEGNFNKVIIAEDVRGMLSLYEACFLSVHGEDIMDEALSFTKQNLEDALAKMPLSPHFAKHIKTALILPFHKCISRLAARQYMSFYQQEEPRNELLLQFAKLDFNRLQLLHQQELKLLSRWWEGLNLLEKLPYIRDRIVEIYVWAIGCHFEPEYAVSRMTVAKAAAMMSLLDDTFDAFGNLAELQLFKEAFDRLNIAAIDKLPDYMQFLYKTVLNVLDEAENTGGGNGNPYGGGYLKNEFKDLVRCYYQEAKWNAEKFVPPLDEYKEIGDTTSTYAIFGSASLIGMEASSITDFECLHSNPNVLKAAKLLGRFKNDLASCQDEEKRGNCVTAVPCIMKEYGVSEEKAAEEVEKICADALKDVNEGCLMPTSIPVPVSRFCLNILRTTEVFYRHNLDGYTKSTIMKDDIISLFMEKIDI